MKCCGSNYTFHDEFFLKSYAKDKLDDAKDSTSTNSMSTINFFDDLIPDLPNRNSNKKGSNPFKNFVFPKTCCPNLNKKNECTKEYIYELTCNLAYENKVKNFKMVTGLYLVFMIVVKIFMFYNFEKNTILLQGSVDQVP